MKTELAPSPQSTAEIKSPSGMFWCYGHLADIPLSERSSDPRYCRRCFSVLKEEAKNNTTDWWVPMTRSTGSRPSGAGAGGGKNSDPLHYSPSQNVTLILCQQCGKPMLYRRKSKKNCGFRCRKAHQRRQLRV